ncbi:MAG TPA: hypothetical protein VF585_01660 [Chthoniobacterales bacterium]
MISTLTKHTIPRNRFQRFLGASAAIFLAGSMASMALTAGEKEIEAYLPNGVTFTTASAEQIRDAAVEAIKLPKVKATTLPSVIVSAATKKVPQFAPVFGEAGLNKVYGQNGFVGIPDNKKTAEAKKLVTSVFKLGLGLIGSEQTRADEAAAIMSRAVNAVRDLPTVGTLDTLTPLSIVVTSALKAVSSPKVNGADAVEGIITGAVTQFAGNSNEDIGSTTPGDNSDDVVKSILTTAAKAAPKRVAEIGRAAGFAFAGTYLFTTTDGSEITVDEFRALNVEKITAAILAGLSAGKAKSTLTQGQIRTAVDTGIVAAFGGGTGVLGSAGVNEFAYNNGQGEPVTDISGI